MKKAVHSRPVLSLDCLPRVPAFTRQTRYLRYNTRTVLLIPARVTHAMNNTNPYDYCESSVWPMADRVCLVVAGRPQGRPGTAAVGGCHLSETRSEVAVPHPVRPRLNCLPDRRFDDNANKPPRTSSPVIVQMNEVTTQI